MCSLGMLPGPSLMFQRLWTPSFPSDRGVCVYVCTCTYMHVAVCACMNAMCRPEDNAGYLSIDLHILFWDSLLPSVNFASLARLVGQWTSEMLLSHLLSVRLVRMWCHASFDFFFLNLGVRDSNWHSHAWLESILFTTLSLVPTPSFKTGSFILFWLVSNLWHACLESLSLFFFLFSSLLSSPLFFKLQIAMSALWLDKGASFLGNSSQTWDHNFI